MDHKFVFFTQTCNILAILSAHTLLLKQKKKKEPKTGRRNSEIHVNISKSLVLPFRIVVYNIINCCIKVDKNKKLYSMKTCICSKRNLLILYSLISGAFFFFKIHHRIDVQVSKSTGIIPRNKQHPSNDSLFK